jgi:hypothetical protein
MSRRKRHKLPANGTIATPAKASVSTLPVPTSKTLAEQIYARLEQAGVIQPNLLPDTDNQAKPTIPLGDRHIPTLHEVIQRERIRGEAAQQFYLQRVGETKKPWFQNPRQEFQYSEFVLVTVEMAREALNFNPDNSRTKIREEHARALSRDIASNRYLPTSESVAFDVRGLLQDGQHRLYAIILAGVPCLIYCTWNVAVESKFVIDSGLKRGTADKLRPIATTKINSKTSAVCRACVSGVRPRTRLTDGEIAEFLLVHEDTLAWVHHQLPAARADIQAVIVKGALWYGREAVQGFCEKFRNLVFPSEKDPVGLLYKWLDRSRSQGAQIGPLSVYKKALSALEHYIDGKEVRALYEREVDIFEWGEGYCVPPRFPNQ